MMDATSSPEIPSHTGIDTTGDDWYDENVIASPSAHITKIRNDANLLTRFTETSNILTQGMLLPIVSEFYSNDNPNTIDDEVGVISQGAASIATVLLALGWLKVKKHPKIKRQAEEFAKSQSVSHPNPAARRFKTSFVIGQKVGEAIGGALFLGFNLPLLGHSPKALIRLFGYPFAILFGIAGVLFFKNGIKIDDEKLFRMGKDGWTKFVKWGFVFGGAIGLVITLSLFTGGVGIFAAYPLAYLIGSAGGSLLGAAIVAAAVPIYHKIKYKLLGRDHYTRKELDEATQYRSNFSRAGIVVGGLIVGIIFGIIGATCWPALGVATGVALGGAIGSVVFGTLFAIIGPWIAKQVEQGASPVNSFDYAIRTGALFGTNGIGLALSAIPVIGPILQLVAGLVTTIIAFVREYVHARNLKGADEKNGKGTSSNHILPWTQRAAPAIVLGGAIFGLIGFFCFPPAGAAILGGCGAFICGLAVCGLEWGLRKKGYLPSNAEVEVPSEESETSEDLNLKESTSTLLRKRLSNQNHNEQTMRDSVSKDKPLSNNNNTRHSNAHPPQPYSIARSTSSAFTSTRILSIETSSNPLKRTSSNVSC